MGVGSRKEWLLWMFERAGKKNSRNKGFQLWQQHNHPIELDSGYLLNQRINYVHMNPVEAGFVEDPNHWVWSSSRDYEMNRKGEVELELI